MSTIESFYNITFDVKRQATVSGTRLDTLNTVSTGNSGVIRPVTKKTDLFQETNWGKESTLYCNDSVSVLVGDRLEVGGAKYDVQVVLDYEDLENGDSHKRITVLRKSQ